MTVARRVAAVEAELDPAGRVLRWLSEAHQHDSFEGYFQATLSAGGEMPLDRLVREASAAGGQHAARDRRTDGRQAAIRETAVRFFLVMRINEVAAQTLEREALLQWALSASLLLASEQGDRATRRISAEQLRDLAISRLGEMHALQDARRTVEGRYLGAAEALFAAASRDWQEQLAHTDRLARMAIQLVELDGGAAIDGDPPLVPDGRTDRCIADLLEPARAKALDLMGDGEGAMGRMRGWLIA